MKHSNWESGKQVSSLTPPADLWDESAHREKSRRPRFTWQATHRRTSPARLWSWMVEAWRSRRSGSLVSRTRPSVTCLTRKSPASAEDAKFCPIDGIKIVYCDRKRDRKSYFGRTIFRGLRPTCRATSGFDLL